VTISAPRYESYQAAGASEWRMRIGPEGGRQILFVPPMFEEMNRTRALVAAVMRLLAGSGHDCILPDLPGSGESARALEEVGWADWREAIASAAVPHAATVAIRGGCLLDDAAAPACAWRLAPADGASLVRDLERSGLVAGGGSAGYAPSGALIDALRAATPAPLPRLRVVRLASDRGEADLKLDGPPLWRRSEPQNSLELARAIACDIETWLQQCAAS
jgi:pimeloyl-ACP methyl ester carboxylesterase